jgi:ribosome-associated toxin RatA of RatAB toxin-antitoxin module
MVQRETHRLDGGGGMKLEEAVLIHADPISLFRLTQDYERRLEWDPFLQSANLIGDAKEAGVGVKALCVSKGGWAMETEYVSFNPPQATAVKMTRGPWFLHRFAGSWRFEEVVPGQLRVSFTYHLEARPKWMCWLLTPILKWRFARDTRNRLRALKEAVEANDILRAGGYEARHSRGIGPSCDQGA